MLLKIFSLTCLFLIKFFIEPTICAAPNNIQNLELDDVTSLWDKFPSLIDKIKEAGMLLRCDKNQGHQYEGHFRRVIPLYSVLSIDSPLGSIELYLMFIKESTVFEDIHYKRSYCSSCITLTCSLYRN